MPRRQSAWRSPSASRPVDPVDGDPALDPRATPAEAIIEAEPGGWWTVGRRVRLGLAAASSVPAGSRQKRTRRCGSDELVPPYDGLNGGYDGRALYDGRIALGLPSSIFAEVPALEPRDRWDPAELVYAARFTTGGGAGADLEAPRHDGGDVDWYSVRATGVPAAVAAAPTRLTPGRLRYPGAPNAPLVADRGLRASTSAAFPRTAATSRPCC